MGTELAKGHEPLFQFPNLVKAPPITIEKLYGKVVEHYIAGKLCLAENYVPAEESIGQNLLILLSGDSRAVEVVRTKYLIVRLRAPHI